jgi:flagellar biogenesis protein FliO
MDDFQLFLIIGLILFAGWALLRFIAAVARDKED